MSKYNVQHDIPFPGKSRRSDSFDKVYPFRDMDPGDSFFVPASEAKTATLLSSLSRMNKRLPEEGEFKGRSTEENGVAGTRIWRVS